MRRRIRFAAVGAMAATAVGGLVLSTGVGATDAPGTYDLSASGGVLNLSVLSLLKVTGGASSAVYTPSTSGGAGTVTATGSGITSPLGNSTQTATVNSVGGSDPSSTSVCGPLPAVDLPPLVSLTAACGTASASEDGSGTPTATATGTLPTLTVGAGLSTLLGSPTAAAGATGAAGGILGLGNIGGLLAPVTSLLNTVGQALPALPGGLSLGSLLSTVTNLTNAQLLGLLEVDLGGSTSTITPGTAANGDATETATATTKGVSIKILPGLVGGSALATITIGDNSATNTVDEVTGAVTASDDPSDISVAVAGMTLLNIGEGTGPTPILAGTPLASTIQIGGGSATPGQGSGSAEAADVKLDLLTGIDGGIDLDLVAAQTSAGGTAAAAPLTQAAIENPLVTPPAAAPAATVVPNVTSVHTGEFWAGPLPIILVAGMALAGAFLIARRRVFSAARSLIPFAHHSATGSTGGLPPGPASGTSSVPPPVSGPARRQSSL
ncbi:MAG TPA: hypothetical protein VHV57_13835 [Acidimicrobiales bacterium]|nr:hypothetical protein [Acidimicrobiales bacterium]